MAASDASPAEPALTLDFVLGADSASVWALRSGEGASAGPRLAYVAGNVGVIYDAGTKKQTLLRGHVRAAFRGAAPRRRACPAGPRALRAAR